MLNFFLALQSMLEQINSARNMRNANAALARSNFAHADQIAAEFLVRLIRLSGEDFKGALTDSVFNEDAAFSLVNSLIEQIEQSEFDDPAPERLATAFQTILDHVLEPSQPRENQPTADAVNFDDIYGDDEEGNREQVGSTASAAEDQEEPDLPQHPDNLIDDEAEEVPPGEESSPGSFEEEKEDGEEEEEEESGVEGEDEGNVEERAQTPSC